ncbi:protein farnesyltransferase subunit beta [Blastomyces gilchristii SLH14081]|uniref:Protein farnesyltransferase subunit beta n=1 Tax=Blastomyces gilchristii (strain SLH14081) TaxID=559298 RepID=A0A179UDF8_BLAGS|nr:protein farnesyltransferase subunit beta [Blastomyces gilchristii SLH14081]OAT06004.1 protein farnesyltransferase subunit beta [Blastomyces gilchristii SLH14081]
MIRGKYRRPVRFPTTAPYNKESAPGTASASSSASSSHARLRTTISRLHGRSGTPRDNTLQQRHKQPQLKSDSSPHTTPTTTTATTAIGEPSSSSPVHPHSHDKRSKKKKKKKEKKKNNMAAPPSLPAQPHYQKSIPDLFTQLPLIRDQLVTETSKTQDATVDQCLPFLKGLASSQNGPFNRFGVPRLDRDEHVSFLYDSLESYPERFVGLDSSRPWMVYWALAGLHFLGEDVTKFRERVIATAAPMQNPTGGFGGGHGQMSHCASSYALILSLALVGGQDAFKLVNRTAMWRWLGKLKQADGGFQVTLGGEEDVRGAYCAMVIIALLDLPLQLPPDSPARHAGLDTFISGLPEYLSRCQTFEGGISGSPGTEAHGAYAFCALACLCILGDPKEMINRYMDLPLLISWLSARQCAPEGGFAGRTNKLVDGCYSHWVGGCWPLIQAAVNGIQSTSTPSYSRSGSLFHREGLTRYILNCCQGPHGGLRDKPGKNPDSYHTCYILSGLSTAQHHHFNTGVASVTGPDNPFPSAFSWSHAPVTASTEHDQSTIVFDEGDRLEVVHPLFVIPHRAAENMREWCEKYPLQI